MLAVGGPLFTPCVLSHLTSSGLHDHLDGKPQTYPLLPDKGTTDPEVQWLVPSH